MDEMGVRPSVISGTSMGAIVGAFYACGMSGADMEDLARSIDLFDYTRMIDLPFLSKSGLVKGKNVMSWIAKNLRVTSFEELKIPLKVVATDFWNRREVVFSEGDLIRAIRASISVPGLFEPVKLDDVVMIDGEPVNPVPMNVLRDECDILIAIDASGTNEPPDKNPVPNMFDNVMTTFQIMESTLIQKQVEIFKPDVYVKPALVNIQILDFHKADEILQSVRDDILQFKVDLTEVLRGPVAQPKKKRFSIFK